MSEIRTYETAEAVAKAAAENAVEILKLAIETHGRASWVLAGGSSPMAAYREVVANYSDALDWSLVTVIMGDERMVPFDHKDSNWGSIMRIFDKNELTAAVQRLVPDTTISTDLAAQHYETAISATQFDRFDLVWLGVGEDGHTLSLFPGHPGFVDSPSGWVIPIYDSPKPPSERITLSLRALEHVQELVIFAVGASKMPILKHARLKGGLPIAVAAEVTETFGGEVRWLYDDAAWGEK